MSANGGRLPGSQTDRQAITAKEFGERRGCGLTGCLTKEVRELVGKPGARKRRRASTLPEELESEPLIKQIMETTVRLNVPLFVKTKVGTTLAEVS